MKGNNKLGKKIIYFNKYIRGKNIVIIKNSLLLKI
jgi:hypothetical protein